MAVVLSYPSSIAEDLKGLLGKQGYLSAELSGLQTKLTEVSGDTFIMTSEQGKTLLEILEKSSDLSGALAGFKSDLESDFAEMQLDVDKSRSAGDSGSSKSLQPDGATEKPEGIIRTKFNQFCSAFTYLGRIIKTHPFATTAIVTVGVASFYFSAKCKEGEISNPVVCNLAEAVTGILSRIFVTSMRVVGLGFAIEG